MFEAFLPTPLPWARIGLSNVFVIVALFSSGFGDAFMVNAVRVVAGNLLLGLTLSPAFLLSSAGSTSALVVMAGVRWKLVPPLSVVGASCLGAVTSNAIQVVLFGILFAGWSLVTDLLGVFVLLGTGVGFVTGLISAGILQKVVLERLRLVD
jgi:heptaprenyl diphosphate synthase